jgi:hypothetical protein
LWRDTVAVWIGPDEVRVRRRRRGLRRSAPIDAVTACEGDGSAAERAASALRQALATSPGPGDVEVVLSNHFVRFGLVANPQSLRNAGERAAAARHELQAIYGESAAGWSIVLDANATRGSAVAAGIDAGLQAAIAQTLATTSLRLSKLRPWLAVASDRARRFTDGREHWLTVVEAGRVVVLRVDAHGVSSLSAHRVQADAARELPELLERQRLVEGVEEPESRVLLVSLDPTEPEFPPGSRWDVRPVTVDFGPPR